MEEAEEKYLCKERKTERKQLEEVNKQINKWKEKKNIERKKERKNRERERERVRRKKQMF